MTTPRDVDPEICIVAAETPMKRYDLTEHGGVWWIGEITDGEYVRYEDAAAEIARLTRERDEARRSRYQTHVYGCRLDGDERTGPCADCDEATKRYDPKGTP